MSHSNHYLLFMKKENELFLLEGSRETGIEPATPSVTGWCSNQLNYSRIEPAFLGATGFEPMTSCV